MPIFSFDPKSAVILVKVTIEGPLRSHVTRMILDTGATYTMVAPEILIDIGNDPAVSKARRAITTASGTEYVSFVNVPLIKTLGVEQKNIEVCAHGLPPNLPARGLLGLNFLRHFNVHLNFLSGKMEITSNNTHEKNHCHRE